MREETLKIIYEQNTQTRDATTMSKIHQQKYDFLQDQKKESTTKQRLLQIGHTTINDHQNIYHNDFNEILYTIQRDDETTVPKTKSKININNVTNKTLRSNERHTKHQCDENIF